MRKFNMQNFDCKLVKSEHSWDTVEMSSGTQLESFSQKKQQETQAMFSVVLFI